MGAEDKAKTELSSDNLNDLAKFSTEISDILVPLMNDAIDKEITDKNNTIFSNKLGSFEYTLNLKLNKEDFLRTYNDFLKEISDINDFE
jgi:hypothetical protein